MCICMCVGDRVLTCVRVRLFACVGRAAAGSNESGWTAGRLDGWDGARASACTGLDWGRGVDGGALYVCACAPGTCVFNVHVYGWHACALCVRVYVVRYVLRVSCVRGCCMYVTEYFRGYVGRRVFVWLFSIT